MTNIFPTDFTEKTTIDSGDFSLVADSADSFKIKKLKTDSLKSIVPGPDGNGIASITTNKVGKTTTVTITEDNSDVTTFDVEDGADGAGSGDVLASGTLTNDTIIIGGGTKTVKSSSKTIVTTLGADDTSVPTSKAVKDITDGKQASGSYEVTTNKETSALDTSTTKYPCNNVVKSAVDGKLPLSGGTMTGKVVSAGRTEAAKTYTPATGSQTVALDCSVNNMHVVTGHANGTAITFTITGATENQPFIVSILQGGTTVSTIAARFSTVRWAGGSAPTLTATLNKRDTFGFIRTGTNTYDGFIIGQNC